VTGYDEPPLVGAVFCGNVVENAVDQQQNIPEYIKRDSVPKNRRKAGRVKFCKAHCRQTVFFGKKRKMSAQ